MKPSRTISKELLVFSPTQEMSPAFVTVFFLITALLMFFIGRFIQKKIKMIWLTLIILPTIFFICMLIAMVGLSLYWKVTGQA